MNALLTRGRACFAGWLTGRLAIDGKGHNRSYASLFSWVTTHFNLRAMGESTCAPPPRTPCSGGPRTPVGCILLTCSIWCLLWWWVLYRYRTALSDTPGRWWWAAPPTPPCIPGGLSPPRPPSPRIHLHREGLTSRRVTS